jgi:hypothetical protein
VERRRGVLPDAPHRFDLLAEHGVPLGIGEERTAERLEFRLVRDVGDADAEDEPASGQGVEVASCFARTAGSRSSSGITPIPSSIRSVIPARNAVVLTASNRTGCSVFDGSSTQPAAGGLLRCFSKDLWMWSVTITAS